MKIEINMEGKRIARVFAIALIGIAIGYTLSMVAPANISGNAPMGYLTSADLDNRGIGTGYLTTADLNREDIMASIVLSRFCEGMGLRSSVYWQQDAQGNVYGLPICLQQQQQ